MTEFALQFIPEEPQPHQDPQPKTGLVEQGMSGVNEGIADFVGMPVDLVTGAINAGTSGINSLTGMNIPQITDPVGGSQSVENLMRGWAVSDTPPQTAGQRYARRVGQEIGFGAPAAMTMAGPIAAASRGQQAAYMGTNIAADVGSGLAGQTAREIAPDNALADIAASLLGGIGMAGAVGAASRSRPKAPTRDEVEAMARKAYQAVEDSGAKLTPQAQQDLYERLVRAMEDEGGDALSHPKAAAQLRKVEKNPRPDVMGVEYARRSMRDHVAKDASEGAMGKRLMAETEGYLRGLKPGDISGADPDKVLSDLMEAREKASRYIKYDEVSDAVEKAKRTASTSGTGGNVLNRQSQEIGKFYDKEVARRPKNRDGHFSSDEVAKMKKVVYPGRGERILRGVGRLSPSTGGLQSALATFAGGGGLVAGLSGANPSAYAAAVPFMAGSGAQMLAERAKGRNIEELLDTILRGGVTSEKKAPEAVKRAIVAQLLQAPKQ